MRVNTCAKYKACLTAEPATVLEELATARQNFRRGNNIVHSRPARDWPSRAAVLRSLLRPVDQSRDPVCRPLGIAQPRSVAEPGGAVRRIRILAKPNAAGCGPKLLLHGQFIHAGLGPIDNVPYHVSELLSAVPAPGAVRYAAASSQRCEFTIASATLFNMRHNPRQRRAQRLCQHHRHCRRRRRPPMAS